MTKLPKLSEPVQRKLQLQWGELTDSQGLVKANLKLPGSRGPDGRMRTGHLQASYEQAVGEDLLRRSTLVAKKRLEQIAQEYLAIWASAEHARTEVFVDWLGEIKDTVVSALTDFWATSEWPPAFQHRCVTTADEAVASLVNGWKSRARSLEIQHLEYPHLSLESLVAAGGDLKFALSLEQSKATIEQSQKAIQSAQEFLNRLNATESTSRGNPKGSDGKQARGESSGMGNDQGPTRELAPEIFADLSGRFPLGDNPFPPEHPFYQPFEGANRDAEKELTNLKLELLRLCQSVSTLPEFTKLLLAYRLARFDVIATKALGTVRDTESARAYENWLRDFAKFEMEDILNKLGRGTPALPDGLLQHISADGLKLLLMEKVEQHNSKALAIVNKTLKQTQTECKAPSKGVAATKDQPSNVFGDGGSPLAGELRARNPDRLAANPLQGTAEEAMDPFTFFKEPRPLGDNPNPPDSSLWHDFEEVTHEAKKRLDSLWSEYTKSYVSTESHSEVLALILEARLKRLDIVAECMLRIFVADEDTGRRYEDWLADLMRAEEKDVLDLVHKEAPHYSEYFNLEKFTPTLLLRQQSYKEKCDAKVIQLIRGRRAARATESATASTQPKPPGALEFISEAISRRSLNVPKLAAEIQGLLRRKPGARLKADRATIFRIVRGQTKWPNPALRDALIEVLQLPVDKAEIVRDSLTRP